MAPRPAGSHLRVDSPVGALVLTARDGALVRLAWDAAPAPTQPDGPDAALLAEAARQLEAYFAGERRDFDLPLAPAGTPFQRRVYEAMAAIPYGATRSYGELAADLGSVARAVGGACGANPLPVVIPCHRVLARGGRLGGFSGGPDAATALDTKTWLLAHEGALADGGLADGGERRQAALF